MNISIIRHAKVNYKWRKWSNSDQYNNDCFLYDNSDIIETVTKKEIPKIRCYTSTLKRSKATAERHFGIKEYTETKLLDEVPLSAAFKTKIYLPLYIWNTLGRIQWLYDSKRQWEGRRETYKRADQLVSMILKKNEDCILVTHGFFMHALIKVMKKRGFIISDQALHYKNCGVINAYIPDNVSRET